MVLNHASVVAAAAAAAADRETVVNWLRDMSVGMAQMVHDKVAQSSVRMYHSFHDTWCLPGYSLADCCQTLRLTGARDEYVFLMRLATKIPLLQDAQEDVAERFRACEGHTLPADDGAPLVLCAIANWIAVGFPSKLMWDRDRINVRFVELLPDETIVEATEKVDNLTRSVHARLIVDRHRSRVRTVDNHRELWDNRGTAFPHLAFGPGVEQDLERAAHLLDTIIGKLADLDQSVEEWRIGGGPAPAWRTRVTSESNATRRDRKSMNARRFPSISGTTELFEWHARYGGTGRIHLRFEAHTREVEVGYIGPHLPL